MSVTPLDYSYHLAYFWQIHENQEPSLTLKMGSTQRGCWDLRLLQNHEWLDFKNRDMVQFFCYRLINLSQREYRRMMSNSASLFLCVWYSIISVWTQQHFAPDLQAFPEVHWRSGSPKLDWLFLCLQHVPAGLSADSVWAALHVHVPCSGAEAENCTNRPCVQEGEAAAPFELGVSLALP